MREARRARSQYTGSKEDHPCMACGYIYDGPHTGQRIAKSQITHTGVFKGTKVSHGLCDPPCAEARELRAPHGRQPKQPPAPRPSERAVKREERVTLGEHARNLDRDIAQAREKWARSGKPEDLRRYQDLQDKRRK